MPDHHPVFELAPPSAGARAVGVRPGDPVGRPPAWSPSPAPTARPRSPSWRGRCSRPAAGAPWRSATPRCPFVAAIDDPTVDVFVVEASSFRLLHSHRFAPDVGTWLNLAPDHLDPRVGSHATPRRLRRGQGAALEGPDRRTRWRSATPTTPSWSAQLAAAPGPPGDLRARAPAPTTASTATGSCSTRGDVLAEVGELHRAFPHDLANALAAARHRAARRRHRRRARARRCSPSGGSPIG